MIHVLLVEDDPDVADVICSMLREAGFRCSVAHNGEQALRLLTGSDIQVIVTDVLLRGPVSGVDIAERGEALGIASVLVTGDGATMNRLDATPHRWLRKPFKSLELIAAVKRAALAVRRGSGEPSQ